MEWVIITVIVLLVGLILTSAYLSWWNFATCHVGHSHVYWEEEWVQQVGDVPVFHPGRCARRWVCDIRCADLDVGGIEAHPDHNPETRGTTYEARCKP